MRVDCEQLGICKCLGDCETYRRECAHIHMHRRFLWSRAVTIDRGAKQTAGCRELLLCGCKAYLFVRHATIHCMAGREGCSVELLEQGFTLTYWPMNR